MTTWIERAAASHDREHGIPEHMYVVGTHDSPESISMFGRFLGFSEEQLEQADMLKVWRTGIKHRCPADREFEIHRLYRNGRVIAEKRKVCI